MNGTQAAALLVVFHLRVVRIGFQPFELLDDGRPLRLLHRLEGILAIVAGLRVFGRESPLERAGGALGGKVRVVVGEDLRRACGVAAQSGRGLDLLTA